MSFHIVNEKRKNGYAVVVRSTIRNEKGKSTSVNCGILGSLDDLKKEFGDEYEIKIKERANEIYTQWFRNNSEKFVTTIYADEDETEDNVFYSSQLYLRKIWNDLGLSRFLDGIKADSKGKWHYDFNEVVFFLTTIQLLNSSSKLSAYNNAKNYLIKPKNLTLDSLYDCLDVLADNMDIINNYTYKQVKKYLDKKATLYFYDVTTVNMSQSVDESFLVGLKKGKEGIYGPLIQIGVVCDQWGLLVGMYVFNGRSNEQDSLKEQVERIFASNECKNVVICTDAGLCSAKNKRYLEKNFKGYIITQPLSYKKVPDYIRDWAIDNAFDANNVYKNIILETAKNQPINIEKEVKEMTKNKIIELYEKLIKEDPNSDLAKDLYNQTFYKSRWVKCESKIYKDKNKKEEFKFKEIYVNKKNDKELSLKDKSEKDFDASNSKKDYIKIEYEQRLVVSFSLKYYYKQLKELDEEKEKAKNAANNNYDISSKSNKDYRRFVISHPTTQNGEVAKEIANCFDNERYEFEKSLCGLYCQATNLSDESKDIYRYSRERWQIEYAFRTAKTFEGLGTVYLQTTKHIIGHFELCFLAQEIFKALVYKIYNHLGYKDCVIGRMPDEEKSKIFTIDKIMDELVNLKTLKMVDDRQRTFFRTLTKKDEINTTLAEVFDFSLTKKGKLLTEIQDKIKEKIEL